jgi:hypothetical protein
MAAIFAGAHVLQKYAFNQHFQNPQPGWCIFSVSGLIHLKEG